MSDVKRRMQSLLYGDRMSGKEELPRVIKSEAYDMLSDFFELEEGRLSVSIEMADEGYEIVIKARAVRVY